MMNAKCHFLQAFVIILITSCTERSLDVQGHRGCRGLMPENTIPAFIHATKMGVTTLELDLVISKDEQVVVSHEPYFSSKISRTPDGQDIPDSLATSHNLYAMNYDRIKDYDVGSKPHQDYPEQQKFVAHKPTLSEVVDSVERLTAQLRLRPVLYNVEIKRRPDQDATFHPGKARFADLVISEVDRLAISDRTCIQSFDMETMVYVHQKAPHMTTAALIYRPTDLDSLVSALAFVPDIISPYHPLVDAKFISQAAALKMQVIPWTVNDTPRMSALIGLGVDGIITDYPDRLLDLCKQQGVSVK